MLKQTLIYLVALVLLSLSSFSFASSGNEELNQEKVYSDLAELEAATVDLEKELANSINEIQTYFEEEVESYTTYSVYYGVWTTHLSDKWDNDYNNDNQLVAVEYRDWVAGTFKNSFYDRTWIAGYNFKYEWNDLVLGAVTGVSYGYDEDDIDDEKFRINYKGWMPVVFPHASYPVYNDGDVEVRPVIGFLGIPFVSDVAATLLVQVTF